MTTTPDTAPDATPDDDGDPATLDLRVRIIETVTAQPGLSRREINEALPDVEPRDISARLQYMCTAARKHRLMRTGDEGRYRYWLPDTAPPDAGGTPPDHRVGIRNPDSVQARVLGLIQADPGITAVDIQRVLAGNTGTVATTLSSLHKRGQVQATGRPRAYRYWPLGHTLPADVTSRPTVDRPKVATQKVAKVAKAPAPAAISTRTEDAIATARATADISGGGPVRLDPPPPRPLTPLESAMASIPAPADAASGMDMAGMAEGAAYYIATILDIGINAAGQVNIRDDAGDVVILTPAQARAAWLFLDRTHRVWSTTGRAMTPGERRT